MATMELFSAADFRARPKRVPLWLRLFMVGVACGISHSLATQEDLDARKRILAATNLGRLYRYARRMDRLRERRRA